MAKSGTKSYIRTQNSNDISTQIYTDGSKSGDLPLRLAAGVAGAALSALEPTCSWAQEGEGGYRAGAARWRCWPCSRPVQGAERRSDPTPPGLAVLQVSQPCHPPAAEGSAPEDLDALHLAKSKTDSMRYVFQRFSL
jgi:hypothetical protein